MTDPNAEVPRPAVDPWADASEPETWTADIPASPPAPPAQTTQPQVPQPFGAPAFGAPPMGGSPYSPGQASVPSYAATEVYPPQTAPVFSGPPMYAYPPEPPRRGAGPAIAIIVGVLVIAVVAAGVFILPKLLSKGSPNANGPSTGSSTGSNNPTTNPPTSQPPPADDLFAGTPAADFQAGAAAIVPPAATAVGDFSASDVSDDLALVKKAMIAGRLDPTMLVNRDPSVLLGLIAPDGRTHMQGNFNLHNAFAFATQLQDGTTLASAPIRAKGTFTVTTQTVNSTPALVIETNYIWVYPLDRHQAGVGANLMVVRDRIDWAFYTQVAASSQGLWVLHARAFGSNMDCTLVGDSDLVAPATVPVTEARTEAGNAYNLDPALDMADRKQASFVC